MLIRLSHGYNNFIREIDDYYLLGAIEKVFVAAAWKWVWISRTATMKTSS